MVLTEQQLREKAQRLHDLGRQYNLADRVNLVLLLVISTGALLFGLADKYALFSFQHLLQTSGVWELVIVIACMAVALIYVDCLRTRALEEACKLSQEFSRAGHAVRREDYEQDWKQRRVRGRLAGFAFLSVVSFSLFGLDSLLTISLAGYLILMLISLPLYRPRKRRAACAQINHCLVRACKVWSEDGNRIDKPKS